MWDTLHPTKANIVWAGPGGGALVFMTPPLNCLKQKLLVKKEKKPPQLNVSDKNSPYALIDKYFPERESYFYQNKNSFVQQFTRKIG